VENLEKSGNSKAVRETEISVMTKGDHETLSGDSVMQDFHLLVARVLPWTTLGELTVLPRIPQLVGRGLVAPF